jgi:hypothetical protein
MHWYLSVPHWRVAKGNKRQITKRNYYMAGEILHVTGHEERNVKKRYSYKQALNGSDCVVKSTPRPLYPCERATVYRLLN